MWGQPTVHTFSIEESSPRLVAVHSEAWRMRIPAEFAFAIAVLAPSKGRDCCLSCRLQSKTLISPSGT